MVNTRVLSQSFAGGEQSPEMFGRLSDVRFQAGAAKLQNLICRPQGPAFKRPGFQFVREAKRQWWTSLSVDIGAETIQLTTDHDIQTGDPIEFSSPSAPLPIPISSFTTYYAIRVDANTIKVAVDRTEALAGNPINLESTGGTFWVFSRQKQAPRLLPFRFALDQTLVIEMGRTTVDSRGIGYFRFHSDGGTLEYGTPPVYVESLTVTNIDAGTNRFTCTAHGFATGDPVTLTMPATWNPVLQPVTFTSGTNQVNWASHGLTHGQQVAFQAEPAPGGSLPPELVAGRSYYVSDLGLANSFAVSRERFGVPITFSSAGTGSRSVTAMPFRQAGAAFVWVDTGVRYYAIKDDADNIRLALNKADATAAVPVPIDLTSVGTNIDDTRVHYRYEAGDLVQVPTGITGVFYCMRQPWDTHGGHDTTDRLYWVRQLANPNLLDVPHFYSQADLLEVTAFQSLDVVTLMHRNRPITELRRLAADRWSVVDVRFNASVSAPRNVTVEEVEGEGFRITAKTAADPSVLTTLTDHTLANGDLVRVKDLEDGGVGPNFIDDGVYLVANVPSTPPINTLTLRRIDTNGNVACSNAVLGAEPRVRYTSHQDEIGDTYAVTTLNEGGEESSRSAKVATSNSLFGRGARNIITWAAVTNAERYRVYKLQSGLFGYIGEVQASEQLRFVDDNIAPDLGITPPILDNSLYRAASVTVDETRDLVLWTDHQLAEGAPVVFTTNGTMPGGIEFERTYYVIEPDDNAFKIAETQGGAVVPLTSAGTGTHTARAGEFPSGGSYFEQRRGFCGSWTRPQDVWLTASGTESDLSYSIPVQDDDRISFRVAAREQSLLRHMVPLSHLLVLGSSAEHRVTPINSDALTPSSVSARSPSHIGASFVQPVMVNNVVLFVAERGGHIREMGLSEQVNDYVTGDISLRAAHLFDGLDIEQMAYSRAPIPVIWCVSTNGTLLGLTYVPEERIGGWHRHTTDGLFRSVASVAEGDEDRLYALVERNILGTAVFHVERMGQQLVDELEDTFFVDAGLTYDNPAAPVATITQLGHLEGESVMVLANGQVQGPFTVLDGEITLPTTTTKAHVGLAYDVEMQTLPVGIAIEAFGQSRTKNVNTAWIRAYKSGGFWAGLSGSLAPSSETAGGSLWTGSEKITVPPSWNLDGQIVVQQSDPLPLTIVALALEVSIGG